MLSPAKRRDGSGRARGWKFFRPSPLRAAFCARIPGDAARMSRRCPCRARWKNIGQMDLARAREIAAAATEVLGHHAEVDNAGAEDVAHLAQHFLHANIGAGIARAVVPGEQQAQLSAGFPAAAESKHPADAPDFNQRADPRDEEKISHARALPATVFGAVALAEEGHGFAG